MFENTQDEGMHLKACVSTRNCGNIGRFLDMATALRGENQILPPQIRPHTPKVDDFYHVHQVSPSKMQILNPFLGISWYPHFETHPRGIRPPQVFPAWLTASCAVRHTLAAVPSCTLALELDDPSGVKMPGKWHFRVVPQVMITYIFNSFLLPTHIHLIYCIDIYTYV